MAQTTCALYFGSFNPFHIGHAAIAGYVLDNCNIESMKLVLTPVNPFKDKSNILSDANVRLQNLEKSVARFNRERREKIVKSGVTGSGNREKILEISTVEFTLPKPNYTYITLQHLKNMEPETTFLLVMGGDNLQSLERWYKGEEILKEFTIMVYPREGYNTEELCRKYGAIYLDAPLMDISSTQIREGIARGVDMSEFLY